jgi:hypothetical protein
MYELMRLSGQEYVDEYASVVKLRLAGKPGPAEPGEARFVPVGRAISMDHAAEADALALWTTAVTPGPGA